MSRIRSVLFFVGLIVSGGVLAQGNITDTPAEFRRTATPFDTTPTADFVGVSATLAQDHMFEFGWWFRVAGDTQETVFGTPATQNYAGTTSTLDWADVAARGLFSAQEITTVTNTAGPSGTTSSTMRIINLSAVDPLTLDLFHMADVDLRGAATDSAVLATMTPDITIHLTDAADRAQYQGIGATAFLVRPFGATDVATELSDAAVDDFPNTGLSFGPGDFTAGFQWAGITIPPGGAASISVNLAINDSLFDADISLSKTDVADPVAQGSSVTYEITASNAGPDLAPGVVVTDTAPPGTTFVATDGCSEDPTGFPTCTLGEIASGGQASYQIQFALDPPTLGVITNAATATTFADDPNLADNTDTEDTLVVVPTADLSVSIADAPDPATQGGPLIYTVDVANAGPFDAPSTVVTSVVPAGITFGSTTGCAEDPAGVPTCTLGTVPNGGNASFSIATTVDMTTLGTVIFSATVASGVGDPNLANDADMEDTTVQPPLPDLTIVKTNDVGGTVVADDVFTWTLAVSNGGGGQSAQFAMGDRIVLDNLPDTNLVFGSVTVTPSGGVTGTIDCAITVADLECTATTAVTIPLGEGFTVEVPAGPMMSGTLDNPRAGGECRVDPDDAVAESSEGNNICSDSVQSIPVSIFADGFEEP